MTLVLIFYTAKRFYLSSGKKPARLHPATRDVQLQDRLFEYCREVSGVTLG